MAASEPSTKGAIFLDRDGVLVEDVGHLRQVSQLRVLPGVADALRSLQTWFYLVVTTNQSGVARGFFTEEELLAIHSALVGQLSDEGVVLDALYYCPHLPDAAEPKYGQDCECRKPKPGLIIKAKNQWGFNLSESYMIGDRPSDIEAGQRAGTKCILAGNTKRPLFQESPVAENLGKAATIILAGRSTTSVTQ